MRLRRSLALRAPEGAATVLHSRTGDVRIGDSIFKQAVYRVVRQVPRGRVISYGAVADLAGHPGAARAVGAALRALPDEAGLPWWRVVNGRGEVSTSRLRHTAQIQRALLEEEAVEFDPAGRISWGRFGWKIDSEDDPDA